MQRTILAGCATIALTSGAVLAQTTQQPAGGTQGMASEAQPQVAEQCLADLEALGARMNEEGWWLTGYRPGVGAVDPAAAPPAATAPAPTVSGADRAARVGAGPEAQPGATSPGTAPMAADDPMASPWADVGWTASPRYEMRTLYSAANILGQRGNEEGCQAVLAELENTYGQYVVQLEELGVQPEEVAGWRGEQILAARPVTEYGALRIDDITGSDVRNPRDEYLGSIEDVVLDPQSGQIAYAILERGGFLGIGGTNIAVRWQDLRVTPNMNTFVLNVPEEAIENAPEVNPREFASQQAFTERRAEIDQFWDQEVENE
jgi:sporulation protein YlmC with PRC-barrel domain